LRRILEYYGCEDGGKEETLRGNGSMPAATAVRPGTPLLRHVQMRGGLPPTGLILRHTRCEEGDLEGDRGNGESLRREYWNADFGAEPDGRREYWSRYKTTLFYSVLLTNRKSNEFKYKITAETAV
jgi:hypothetical protein